MKNKIFLLLLVFFAASLFTNADDLKVGIEVITDAYYVISTSTVANANKNKDFQNLVDAAKPLESANRGGFQVRRVYLAFDRKLDDKLSARLRFEMGHSNFKDSSSAIPFVKDAYLVYQYIKGHRLTLGIVSPPGFGLAEKLWAYRVVEKSAGDLNGLRSSRDTGIMLSGKLMEMLSYTFLVGNGNSQGSEKPTYKENKSAYFAVEFRPVKELVLQLYGDFDLAYESKKEKHTAHVLAGYDSKMIKASVLYIYQQSPNPAHTFSNVLSIPLVFKFSDHFGVFARYDSVKNRASLKDVVSNFIIAGIHIKPSKYFDIMPHIEFANYIIDGTADENSDMVFKFTVVNKF